MKIIQGDILNVRRGIIVHQVNCRKACGGLAGALSRQFPEAFEVYFIVACPDFLGNLILGHDKEDLYIGHLFGQDLPGANTDLKAVEKALKNSRKTLLDTELPLYAPFQMGCGLGGGDWKLYSALLGKYLPTLTIIQKYP
jgi:O-acetyl-ADP-ribose deacetylase (regulator of RNase III)